MPTTEETVETVEPVDRLGGLLARRPDLAGAPYLCVTMRAAALESA